METLASELAEALALKDRMKAGEVAGDELEVSALVYYLELDQGAETLRRLNLSGSTTTTLVISTMLSKTCNRL
jgi:hypothetical protein